MIEALRQAVDRFYHRCLSEAERRGVEPYRVMVEFIKSNRDMNPWALSIIWTNLSKRFKMSEESNDRKKQLLASPEDMGSLVTASPVELDQAYLGQLIVDIRGDSGLAVNNSGVSLTTVPMPSGGYNGVGMIDKSDYEFISMISVDCGFDMVDTQFKDNQASLAAILNGIASHDHASPEIRQAAENLLTLITASPEDSQIGKTDEWLRDKLIESSPSIGPHDRDYFGAWTGRKDQP